MSPATLAGLYLGRRDQYGYPALGTSDPIPPAPRAAHRHTCFLLGIRDPEVVEALWRERVAKAPARKKRRGN